MMSKGRIYWESDKNFQDIFEFEKIGGQIEMIN